VTTCAELETRLFDLLDRRLDAAASVRLHGHLGECAACRERVALWDRAVPAFREVVPPAPDAMATRRMQVEIERLVGQSPSHPITERARRWLWPGVLAGVAAAAAAVFFAWPRRDAGLFTPRVHVAERTSGAARAATRTGGAPVAFGEPVTVAAGATEELALERGSSLRLTGPARIALEGSPTALTVRLAEGSVDAQIAHRRSDERFAVATRDFEVEVRGTTFSVTTGSAGSRVHVSEGRVAVRLPSGDERPVSAGEGFDWPPVAAATDAAPASAPRTTEVPAPACGPLVRACSEAARAARQSMRAGDADEALRVVARASASSAVATAGGGATCRALGACEDELRYLRAEALRQAGRFDEAVAVYRAIDRRGGTIAMRQNAALAAAQIEERENHLGAACSDYARALDLAPRGALGEDALVGSMECAAKMGEGARARDLARRYLSDFPHGLRVQTARRLAGGVAAP
jgi:ferric-dicitrate binding protein FerR (iron transport regulator)